MSIWNSTSVLAITSIWTAVYSPILGINNDYTDQNVRQQAWQAGSGIVNEVVGAVEHLIRDMTHYSLNNFEPYYGSTREN